MRESVNALRPIYGIYGAGGCGRGVLPVAASMLSQKHGAGAYDLVYIDDDQSGKFVNDRRVLKFEEFLETKATFSAISIAIADSRARSRLAKLCREHRVQCFSVISPTTVIMDSVELGEGAIISPFVTLTSNIRIGRQFHANIYSYVEHDCVIGDFVTFAPSVRCNGNVVIEDFAYLGAGCIIRQGRPGKPLTIGSGALVGMGAVVLEDVAPGEVVVGNPAQTLVRS